jgi:hypothetical protein
LYSCAQCSVKAFLNSGTVKTELGFKWYLERSKCWGGDDIKVLNLCETLRMLKVGDFEFKQEFANWWKLSNHVQLSGNSLKP